MFDDADADVLIGRGDEDWYFANVLGDGVHDVILGRRRHEVVTDL